MHRNLDDDQLRRIGALGGVVNVAAAIPMFIDGQDPSAERVVDHIEHLIEVVGVDHVGIGPDFIEDYFQQAFGGWQPVPGMDNDVVAAEVERPADLPKLTEAMVARGFAKEDIAKVLGGNALRVLHQVMGVPGE